MKEECKVECIFSNDGIKLENLINQILESSLIR